ncbi:hypothetical protein LCGC14_0962210 [marine sediment metagenome]|uniref:HNH nuclease domain-containing protein n=1 Tax=marine sediment metagenome TaxID=412755 RepID=A0A0F9RKR4_9ZZZZ
MTKKQKELIVKLRELLKKEVECNRILLNSDNNSKRGRNLILERDNFECRICGNNNLQLDIHHIKPKEFGGEHKESNLITLCKSCHMFMHCNPTLVIKSKQGISTAIKQGLDRAKVEGKKLGRQKGSKDKSKRRTDGYHKVIK